MIKGLVKNLTPDKMTLSFWKNQWTRKHIYYYIKVKNSDILVYRAICGVLNSQAIADRFLWELFKLLNNIFAQNAIVLSLLKTLFLFQKLFFVWQCHPLEK